MLSAYAQTLLIFAGINVIAAFSFYVPFKTGQISLGQAGFMAVGAYASAIMTAKWGLPFPVGLVFGGVVAAIIGVGVGFPALRIKGIYLLLLTLGFAEIVQDFLVRLHEVLNFIIFTLNYCEVIAKILAKEFFSRDFK